MLERLDAEVLVVGAGPAGIAAATAAATAGASTLLVDDNPAPGGQIWRAAADDDTAPAGPYLQRLAQSGAVVRGGLSVVAESAPGVLLAEGSAGAVALGWRRLILATGARELLLPFPGWTLPGVMGAGGLQAMVKHGLPIAGQRVVVAGSGPLLLAVAACLQDHGAHLVAFAEQAPLARVARFGASLWRQPGKLGQAWELGRQLKDTVLRWGWWPLRVAGEGRVERVTLTNGRELLEVEADYLACGFGLIPNVELPRLLGCAVLDGRVLVDRWQRTSRERVYGAGEPVGIGGVDVALREGQQAGWHAAGGPTSHGQPPPGGWAVREREARFRAALAAAYALRAEVLHLADDETIVCRCEDVTLGQLRRYGEAREAKLQTRCGMGACQGRICGAATQAMLGWNVAAVRPPLVPTRVATWLGEEQT